MFTIIRNWISNPIFEGDEEKTRVAGLISTIIVIFIVSALLYGLFAPIEREAIPLRVMIIGFFILLLLALKQAINQGYVRGAGISVVSALWLLFTFSMVFGPTVSNPAIMGYTVVVVCAGLLLSWRAAIGWGVFSIITSFTTLILEQFGITKPAQFYVSGFSFWSAEVIYILVITILLSQTTRKIAESFASARHELEERQRIQSEHEKVIRELETKNAELERFTYTVSHDLKSPLITIGGFIGLLEEDVRKGDNEEMQKDINRISEAKDKMYRLLNELLELSRIGRQMNHPSSSSFGEIVHDALELTKGRLMEANTEVIVQDHLPEVYGDRPRLVEVMQNLIDNAAKFTVNESEARIEIGAESNDKETIFYVKDNGIGIEPEFQERIFGLFDKLEPNTEGTGVGLTLVKRIIEVHGGRIWVESAGEGQGTKFCFTLPKKISNGGAEEMFS